MKFCNKNRIKAVELFFLVLLLNSCATYKPQYGKNIVIPVEKDTVESEISHRFYLIGDAGNADHKPSRQILELFEKRTNKADKNSTLIFLGDNIYPNGMPSDKNSEKRKQAEEKLTYQLEIAKKFKGKTVFISGNHDWYNGIEGLEQQAEFVTKYLDDKKAFLPQNSCGIERLKINNEVVLLVVDSQWFLEDWNKIPTINDDCDIKTHEAFFDEIKSELNKNQDKIVVLAIHHPLISNSSHGGQTNSWRKNYFLNFFRPTIGIPQDIQSKPYSELANRIKTLIADRNNVVVVSGHEHNLQYTEQGNIRQIISGAGSKTDEARAVYPNDFSAGKLGYAILDIYKDQAARVDFYVDENAEEQHVFGKYILFPAIRKKAEYPSEFPKTISASIYSEEMTQKSKFYDFLFGKKYRKYYSQKIEVPVLQIDTLFGGLTPLRAGGGMQSNSLRLADKNGKEYAMRSLKKSTTRFIQNTLYPKQFVGDMYENTSASDFLYDFYTSSNQYYGFIISHLAKPVGVFHTNPKLVYVPKQKDLGTYNNDFGNELYMIEERPMSEHSDSENFGGADDIISTSDLFLNLQKNEKSKIDEQAYIRARLFDMLIGDWDRHQDQWRWSEFQNGKEKIYKPIPRDRDQAFAKYDGALLSLLLKIPATRHIQHFDAEVKDKNLKWLNKSGYPLDMRLLNQADEEIWVSQAKYIQEHLTDEAIDFAFAQLPEVLQDETAEDVKTKLKARRNELQKWASKHYRNLQKTIVITGTDKRERFEITRLPQGKTQVKTFRIKKDSEELVHEKIYSKELTNEIWIYGLDDEDIFQVNGKSDAYIKIRLIGGQNNDLYQIENGKKVVVYDYKTKKNRLETDQKTKVCLTDNYDINNYDYKKPKYNIPFLTPNAGFNPDDGVWLGAMFSYQINGFVQDPFTQKHNISALYAFETNGVEAKYNGIFANVWGIWDLHLNARFTSPSFSVNYFGAGNTTENLDDDLGMDFNRVRMQSFGFAPSLVRNGRYGTTIEAKIGVENIKIEKTENRIMSIPDVLNPDVFDDIFFAKTSLEYAYNNYDNTSFPTMGFTFSANASWTINLEETKRNFPVLEAYLGFTRKITRNGKLTFGTIFKTKAILGNDFEFYQGASIGGNNGLRGYRNERFLGKTSYTQSSDIRLVLGSHNKGLIPVKYGIMTGYDYGRVWLKDENSNRWHQSYGGGFWLGAAELLSVNVNFFHSEDGNRITAGLGFNF